MVREIPEVQQAIRFGLWRTTPISYEDKRFTAAHMLIADSTFFTFFSFPLISGDPNTVLKGTNKIVLTKSAARRYFGDEDPIGKIITWGSDKTAAEVTGVAQDPPHNSHIAFDVVLSGESWEYLRTNTQWTSSNIYTYVRLHPGADPKAVKTKLDVLTEKNMGVEIERFLGMTFSQFRSQGNAIGLLLQPMNDIHLYSDLGEEITPNGNVQYLYIFGAIAAFIILIACINFMNLSTARSANRAKEVGVRKVAGAVRGRLIRQFLSESILYSVLSMVVALLLITVLLQPFNILSGKVLTLAVFTRWPLLAGIIAFTLLLGIVAGSYPAFYLTAFQPAAVLKGKVRAGFKNSGLRNGLVVFQFVISIALILGSLVVYRQLRFMQDKHLGFDKENIVDLLHTYSLGKNAAAFKQEVMSHPVFKGASFANRLPPHVDWNSAFRKGGTDQDFLLSVYQTDHDHLATMGYTLVEGRFFSRDFPTDTLAVVLNETAYKQMGYDQMENQTVISYNYDTPTPLKLIGIIKDFNFESVRNSVKPMAILLGNEPNAEMAIRLAAGNTQEQIKLLESIWKKHSSSAFEYTFLDQNFDALFHAEQRMARIVMIFTLLTIFIACLGLFGLAAYTGEQRAKEISIRKVLGASLPQVLLLLVKDFMLLVVIAFVIAAPLGWYALNRWLEGFAYRTSVDLGIIALSGFAALCIAILTISFQSLQSARESPVRALKGE
jgi:putative ABC transport system permease protein